MDVDVCRIASAHEIALLIAILRIADEDVSIIIVGIEPGVLVALDAHRGLIQAKLTNRTKPN